MSFTFDNIDPFCGWMNWRRLVMKISLGIVKGSFWPKEIRGFGVGIFLSIIPIGLGSHKFHQIFCWSEFRFFCLWDVRWCFFKWQICALWRGCWGEGDEDKLDEGTEEIIGLTVLTGNIVLFGDLGDGEVMFSMRYLSGVSRRVLRVCCWFRMVFRRWEIFLWIEKGFCLRKRFEKSFWSVRILI